MVVVEEVVCLSQKDRPCSSRAEPHLAAPRQAKAFRGIRTGQQLEMGGVSGLREDMPDLWVQGSEDAGQSGGP